MNFSKNITFGGTAIAVLIATSFATAYGQGNGNNQPSGLGGTQTPANVVVTNTPAQPVPMKDQNNGAYQPYYLAREINFQGSASAQLSPAVPPGKRLVIDAVSAHVYVFNSAGSIPFVRLGTGYNDNGVGRLVEFNVPLTYVGQADTTQATWAATLAAPLYIDPNQTFSLVAMKGKDINGLFSGSASAYISVIGHLVDVP
jgi:hypothetical protein